MPITAVLATRLDPRWDRVIIMPTDQEEIEIGTRWLVRVAGSRRFGNYRHQADVCHAYLLLKRGGFKDENVVIFMYGNIADNEFNPRLIINHH